MIKLNGYMMIYDDILINEWHFRSPHPDHPHPTWKKTAWTAATTPCASHRFVGRRSGLADTPRSRRWTSAAATVGDAPRWAWPRQRVPKKKDGWVDHGKNEKWNIEIIYKHYSIFLNILFINDNRSDNRSVLHEFGTYHFLLAPT